MSPAPLTPAKLLTVPEARARFPVRFRPCVETIRRWCRTGQLKSTRWGRSYLIPNSEIVRVINAHWMDRADAK